MTSQTHRASLNIAALAIVALLACLLFAGAPGLTSALAYLSPALFVVLLLWLGRYPGETAMLALSRPKQPRRASAICPPSGCVRALIPRGSSLLAASLAGRAPPVEYTPLLRPDTCRR